MNEQNSYGTGRAPEKKSSHLPIILLLLAVFVATHVIRYYHPPSEATHEPTEKPEALLLPDRASTVTAALPPDGCGLGLTFGELTEPQQKYWSLPSGVYIEEIDANGAAYAAGLRAGDVLVRVGSTAVYNTQSCTEAMKAQMPNGVLTLHYYREGSEYRADIPLTP